MRKKFLVKPALQLRHLTWTLILVFLCALVCYFIFESMVGSAVLGEHMKEAQWLILRGHLRWGFGVALLILLGAVGLENYFFFHTVVGPIYALEKGLKRLTQGDFNDVTRVRASDELSEVITAFEDMKKQIISKIESHEKTALLLATELDRLLANASVENIKELKSKLKEIRDQVEKKAA